MDSGVEIRSIIFEIYLLIVNYFKWVIGKFKILIYILIFM